MTSRPDPAPSAPLVREPAPPAPSAKLVLRWQRYLANEVLEEKVYRALAQRKKGDEKEILLALADAEARHQEYWRALLGPAAGKKRLPEASTLVLAFLGRMFGTVFVLALAQQSETRSPYDVDVHASAAMAADEKIHAEVVRALSQRSRARLSGNFRAAVFGANDGLVSNLALVLGVGAAGMASGAILLTGISGLLAGAMSMAAGEFISVRSQRELVDASRPDPEARRVLADLDIDANELALVFRARGMPKDEAESTAVAALREIHSSDRKKRERARSLFGPTASRGAGESSGEPGHEGDHAELGTALGAASSSFCFFASGAVIPILPYLVGLEGWAAVLVAVVLVGAALLLTGGITGILSGRSPFLRAMRQLAIGFGAAGITYVLGLLFGTTIV